MYLIDNNLVLSGVDEIIEIRGFGSSVLLGKVRFCRLYRRRNLDLVDAARLYLRLYEVMHLAADALANDSEIADLILENYLLSKNSFVTA